MGVQALIPRPVLKGLLLLPLLSFPSACEESSTGPGDDPDRLDVRWTDVALPFGSYANFSCGLTDEGVAYCWGGNSEFGLGTGGGSDQVANEPVLVEGGILFRRLTAGEMHVCGLSEDGNAYCWGVTAGRGGVGPAAPTPTPIPGGITFDALSGGWGSTCGLDEEGGAFCWRGHGNEPQEVPGGLRFKDLNGPCGLTVGGDLYCWSWSVRPETGTWRLTDPIQFSFGLTLESLDQRSVCALDQAGEIHCWQDELTYYTKGQGDLRFKAISGSHGLTVDGLAYRFDPSGGPPVQVPGGTVFATLSEGDHHTCATTRGGRAYCWGCNIDGQLGDGSGPVSPGSCAGESVTAPVLVKNPRK